MAAVAILWAHTLQNKGTFLGLIGAGMAVALKEPLLSIAGRLAIFSGHMYTAGDRIELQEMKGDVIDVGFFYTRMLEIGSRSGIKTSPSSTTKTHLTSSGSPRSS